MRTIKLFAALGVLALAASDALGHGFSLSLSGNTLVGTSGDYPGNGNPSLFTEVFVPLGGIPTSEHGAAGTSFFGTGKSLSIEVVGPLWYSDGNPATTAGTLISLQISSQAALAAPISITGSSTLTPAFPATFPITGNDQHEFLTELLGATFPADDGVYGIAYRVKGGPAIGGAPYNPTELFVATWMTPGFDPGEDPLDPESPLQMAVREIYDAATAQVPEPSSMVLASLGSAALFVVGWRRRRAKCYA